MKNRPFSAGWTVLGAALISVFLSACASSVPRATPVAEGVTRVELGKVGVTMLSDGQGARVLDANFVRNASLAEVQADLQAAGLPTDKLDVPYNSLVVDVGAQRVLFDTGNGEFGGAGSGKLLENMSKAGIDPKSITAVVISHFHGDHINGLRNKAGQVVFPNAKIYVPTPEWNWWMDEARYTATPEASRGGLNTARRVFGPLAGSVIRFEPGKEVLPGVRSIAAFGHTPGHTVFMIEGGSRKLLYWADTTNVSMFVRNPEWAVMFDMDAEAAKATRRRIADLAIAENALVAGFHLTSPGVGTLSVRGKGYDFTPLK
ncbi:MBL fold metallo-hydrolase [Uliginosibacterium aquaticum]|uniref:MBL fold metallo-hydrolase n=1 Tax=Uliginosibacterium aquaticum TaxID=2731212 RepID=A0ABX2ID23_9RHOO|nr:MBL fold metallo-hydrolase [Uliginosibacterium aquaticum]NSL54454.1 MBL fold metallo-hydrolase [Uliginosibacterium aquaticum]